MPGTSHDHEYYGGSHHYVVFLNTFFIKSTIYLASCMFTGSWKLVYMPLRLKHRHSYFHQVENTQFGDFYNRTFYTFPLMPT